MRMSLICIARALSVLCLLGLAAYGTVPSTALAADATVGPTFGQAKASRRTPDLSESVRVTFIDVGKGDCVLVQAGDSSVLIDAGYESTAADVLSCLEAQGVDHLDALIITHYDRDHVGGTRAIGEGAKIDTIYLPEYEGADKNYSSCISAIKALGVTSRRVTKEIALDLGTARLAILPSGVAYVPNTGNGEGNDNDASLVVTLVNGSDSYLFAGDLEKDGIAAYLKAQHGEFDVVKMPHHGRFSSNTADYIDDVNPQIAVITDAKKDSADKKTLKLLKSADVETYRTSADGTIVVESDGTGTYSVSSSKSS